MPTAWNLFRIGRQPRNEDQLTEMLVWLAGSVPAVCHALHQLAFEGGPPAAGEVTVTTQHAIATGRLDALFRWEHTALIVESKVDSVYGDDQISRYLHWLVDEVEDLQQKGLMTLTARPVPWTAEDRAFAEKHGIRGAERLWEELHVALDPVTTAEGGLGGQLVSEFLEMLAAEGLVPTQPLTEAELGTLWADSWSVVRRYREFFHACKESFAEALQATAQGAATWSDRGDWFWQDYNLGGDVRLVVGLFCTDEHEKAPGFAPTRQPLVWMAAKVENNDDWPEIAKRLEANPPEGWYLGKRWYGERPNIWRPLAPLLATPTFDGQREALAGAVADARIWLQDVIAAAPVRSA